MSPPPAEKKDRRFRRRTVRILVDFQCGNGFRCEYATILGAGGLFVSTEDPLEVGSPIMVRFRLPGGEQVHQIEGRVVWNQRAISGERIARAPGMGVEFVNAVAAGALVHELEGMG
jgi:uncharacterized protein (TIGR02266 family)